MQRRYLTENIINCRDLGGYPCRDGSRVTGFGRAIRCGIPKTPTKKDIELLKSIGVKTVLDLRGNAEAESMPSYFIGDPDFDYHHISLLEANPALSEETDDVFDLYISSLNEYSENYAQALRVIAGTDEPFLFHCFLGKDRTGILAALLLKASGVENDDIIADYEVSFTYIRNFVRAEMASGSGLIWEKSEDKLHSPAGGMGRLLRYIDEARSGAEGYFRNIGLSENEIAALSRIL